MVIRPNSRFARIRPLESPPFLPVIRARSPFFRCYWFRLDLLCWRRECPAPMTAPLAACPVAAPIAAPAAAPFALLWSFCCFGAWVFCWVCICCGVCIGCGAGVAAGGGPGFAGCVCANAGGTIAVADSAITHAMVFPLCFIRPPFSLPLFRSANVAGEAPRITTLCLVG